MLKAVPAPVPPRFVRAVLERSVEVPEVAARMPYGAETEIAVRITGDRELKRLNRQFLSEDAVTDVLSFPSGGGEYAGDIAISWPAVVRQAGEYGHSVEVELALLCCHGLLHLLGWDHAVAAEAAEMNRLTVAALERSALRPAPGRL